MTISHVSGPGKKGRRKPARPGGKSSGPQRKSVSSTKGGRPDLALAAERNALALESINENVYDWNVETDEVYFSPSLRRMLGLEPDQPITREIWAGLIHPDDQAGHRRLLVAHFKGQTPRFESEFRYYAADGSLRWARQHGLARRRPDGRVIRLVGATGDITEVKQREREFETVKAEVEAARRLVPSGATQALNEERYALALESINEGVYDWNIEADTFSYAPGLRGILDLSLDELRSPSDWVGRRGSSARCAI
jgi:PAS domain S-box-containing protein